MHVAFKNYLDQTLKLFLKADLVSKTPTDYSKRQADRLVVQTCSKFITIDDPMKVVQRAA